ncbi:hypothetical protein [Pseudoclavibacter sp. AY1H1]|uniref:hypothetical protein n=1 Tax=Pseudoclavibacter sp. AY1H1 TaxID=2080584 RepID=UPI000CE7D632|nr:hypothetical protein [Pseudoclavibacter sp. AY1H1]PPF32622.1 hypothetical protein C5E05_19145 [Pseudoclavibacter sp. AY1H1]
MSNNSGSSNGIDGETLTWIFLLCGLGGGGLFALNRLAKPLTDWLVNVHVLAGVDADLVLDFGNGSGLDIIRLVILGVIVLLLIVGTVAAVQAWRRARRRLKEAAVKRREERDRR